MHQVTQRGVLSQASRRRARTRGFASPAFAGLRLSGGTSCTGMTYGAESGVSSGPVGSELLECRLNLSALPAVTHGLLVRGLERGRVFPTRGWSDLSAAVLQLAVSRR